MSLLLVYLQQADACEYGGVSSSEEEDFRFEGCSSGEPFAIAATGSDQIVTDYGSTKIKQLKGQATATVGNQNSRNVQV